MRVAVNWRQVWAQEPDLIYRTEYVDLPVPIRHVRRLHSPGASFTPLADISRGGSCCSRGPGHASSSAVSEPSRPRYQALEPGNIAGYFRPTKNQGVGESTTGISHPGQFPQVPSRDQGRTCSFRDGDPELFPSCCTKYEYTAQVKYGHCIPSTHPYRRLHVLSGSGNDLPVHVLGTSRVWRSWS